MAGTLEGGKRAAETNKARFGEDYYKLMGVAGGKASRGGGFTDRERARAAGIKGGKASRRGSVNVTVKG